MCDVTLSRSISFQILLFLTGRSVSKYRWIEQLCSRVQFSQNKLCQGTVIGRWLFTSPVFVLFSILLSDSAFFLLFPSLLLTPFMTPPWPPPTPPHLSLPVGPVWQSRWGLQSWSWLPRRSETHWETKKKRSREPWERSRSNRLTNSGGYSRNTNTNITNSNIMATTACITIMSINMINDVYFSVRISIRENVDLIRLQKQLSDKSTALRVTQEKFNNLQEVTCPYLSLKHQFLVIS